MEADGITVAIGAGTAGGLFTLLGQWIRARYSKAPADDAHFVGRKEYDADRHEDQKAHENLFARMATCEQASASTKAVLDIIQSDVRDVKNLLMKGSRK